MAGAAAAAAAAAAPPGVAAAAAGPLLQKAVSLGGVQVEDGLLDRVGHHEAEGRGRPSLTDAVDPIDRLDRPGFCVSNEPSQAHE
jgi:hypothetical protein